MSSFLVINFNKHLFVLRIIVLKMVLHKYKTGSSIYYTWPIFTNY